MSSVFVSLKSFGKSRENKSRIRAEKYSALRLQEKVFTFLQNRTAVTQIGLKVAQTREGTALRNFYNVWIALFY